jgi:hypothetical protein
MPRIRIFAFVFQTLAWAQSISSREQIGFSR